jgi:hypothetical protein
LTYREKFALRGEDLGKWRGEERILERGRM